MITKAQRDLLARMGATPNALRNDDDLQPKWWVEGQSGGVRAQVAQSLMRLGLVDFTGQWGEPPDVLGYTITEAGRRALDQVKGEGGGDD